MKQDKWIGTGCKVCCGPIVLKSQKVYEVKEESQSLQMIPLNQTHGEWIQLHMSIPLIHPT